MIAAFHERAPLSIVAHALEKVQAAGGASAAGLKVSNDRRCAYGSGVKS
jgi:hypothetical protein